MKRSRRGIGRKDGRKDNAETLRRRRGAEEEGIFLELESIFLELESLSLLEKGIAPIAARLWRS
jgi:hypothetical protein